MKSNKLNQRYNSYHPIDKFIYVEIVDKIDPIFKNLGLKPNHITILSLIIRLYSLNLLKNNEYEKSIILFNIGYILDCMDGHMARKYNMGTKFGDKLDHYCDWIITAIAFIIVDKKLDLLGENKLFSIISIILLILCLIDTGLQEKIFDSEFTSFKLLKKINISDKCKKYTKYFGVGLIPLYYTLTLLYIKNN